LRHSIDVGNFSVIWSQHPGR